MAGTTACIVDVRCPLCDTELETRIVMVDGQLHEILKCFECGYTEE